MVYGDACPLILENHLTMLARILSVIYAGLYVLFYKLRKILGLLQVTVSKLLITREIFENLD